MLPYRDSRFVKITLIFFFLFLVGYGYYEAQAMLFGPRISVPSDSIVVHDAFTLIRGRATNISELRLNGATVSVTEDGVFEEPYLLMKGENRVVLDATDKYGRTTQKSIEIIYVADDNEPVSPSAGTSPEASTTNMAPEEESGILP